MTNPEPDIFSRNDIIDGKFVVHKRLGKGGYGEIYSTSLVNDDENMVAVKVERVGKQGNLVEEIRILQSLKDRGCKYIPDILSSGKHENKVHYLSMELLGENLSVLRRKQPSHTFNLKTTMALGMCILRSIKSVHDRGYLHRDIKPGNFVSIFPGSDDPRKILIIDFGLSRRHMNGLGSVRPKQQTSRWVGSRRYMSPNTHLRKDQGRRDDLWSFLYVLIEFYTGTLPWGQLRGPSNLDKIRDMKLEHISDRLTHGLPQEFSKMLTHIRTLKYEQKPNYGLLFQCMKKLYLSEGGDENFNFEWEESDSGFTPIPLELSESDTAYPFVDRDSDDSESSNGKFAPKRKANGYSGKTSVKDENGKKKNKNKKKKRRCNIQ